MKYTKTVRIRLKIQELAARRGIDSAYALWKQFGGSKSTTTQLWHGDVTGLNFDTMEKLCTILKVGPAKLFAVEEIEKGGETWEAGFDKTRAGAPGGESEWSKSTMNLPALKKAVRRGAREHAKRLAKKR